jgi:hypothetical protein
MHMLFQLNTQQVFPSVSFSTKWKVRIELNPSCLRWKGKALGKVLVQNWISRGRVTSMCFGHCVSSLGILGSQGAQGCAWKECGRKSEPPDLHPYGCNAICVSINCVEHLTYITKYGTFFNSPEYEEYVCTWNNQGKRDPWEYKYKFSVNNKHIGLWVSY